MLAEFGSSIVATERWNTRPYTDRHQILFQLSITVWFSMSAIIDTTIALALLWQFHWIKSPFKNTQSLVHKLMASTIRTGAVTSVVAVIMLVLFLIDNESNACMTFGFCVGRIYALTMLYNLNNRSSIKGGPVITNGDHSGEIDNSMNMTGIHVIRTTTFHSESLVRLHTVQCILSCSAEANDGI